MRLQQILGLCLLCFTVSVTACGTDTLEGSADGCGVDTDCPSGEYCGAGNICTKDCSSNEECGAGETCSADGRCIAGGTCDDASDCDSPPRAPVCEDNTLVDFAAGECVDTGGVDTCQYTERRTPCENGCEDGACVADACSGKVCNTPPLPVCAADGGTRTVYQATGTCSEGTCSYSETTESCALGCTNGVCNPGACDEVVCDTAPATECDKDTVVSYDAAGVCDDSTGSPVCKYPITFENCLYTGSECSTDTCINPITQVGGIVIVEYMANPEGSFVDGNEWFEITNTSGAAIDLTGWKIQSGGSSNSVEEHVIADNPSTSVPAFPMGGRLLFGRAADATPGSAIDYVYDGISMANGGDYIQLVDPSGAIADYVYYEPGSLMGGRSRKYNPAFSDDTALNDDFTKWCPSMTDEYTTSPSNFGTPGAANTACTVDVCSVFTCVKPDDFCLADRSAVQFAADAATCESTRFNNPYCDFLATDVDCQATQLCALGVCEMIPANGPGAGEIIFTEFLGDPNSVSDSKGEWFEVFNTTSADISLFSVVFKDNELAGSATTYTIRDTSAIVPAQGRAVFARNTDPAENGGVVGAFEFSGAHLKNSPDPTYRLSLVNQDGSVIDESFYGPKLGTKVPKGASIQLDGGKHTGAENLAGENWCEGTQDFGDGDKGTPGAANATCP